MQRPSRDRFNRLAGALSSGWAGLASLLGGSVIGVPLLGGLVLLGCPGDGGAAIVDDWIRGFANSEIRFQRGTASNVPFVPLAYADVGFYNDTEIEIDNDGRASFDQWTISQAAALPILLGPRDALVVGEWVSWSSFETASDAFDSFEVWTVGIPVGWLHQIDPAWQAAAFVMPLGSKSSLEDASWGWQTLGGGFGRFTQSDHLWWAFGFFFDVGPGEDTYLPYLGASWDLTEKWTLSAIMPWPAVLYAPTPDTLFRFGASPSGTSWALRPASGRVSFELDSWDLGLTAERRVHGNLWVALKAGVGGLRAFQVTDGEWEGPEIDLGAGPFISIGINYRPALLD